MVSLTTLTTQPAASTAVDSIRINQPEADAVLFNEIKEHSRIDLDSEEALVTTYVAEATNYVEDYISVALIDQTWIDYFAGIPSTMVLSRRPLRYVIRVEEDWGSSPSTEIAAEFYTQISQGYRRPARITLSNGWPRTNSSPSRSVGVVYCAGFGPTWDFVPPMLRGAVVLATAILYEDRVNPDFSPVHMKLADWRPPGVA